jgi:hypothetical protein
MIELWAEKELRNLIRMKNAGNKYFRWVKNCSAVVNIDLLLHLGFSLWLVEFFFYHWHEFGSDMLLN